MSGGTWYRRLFRGSDAKRARAFQKREQALMRIINDPKEQLFRQNAVAQNQPGLNRLVFGTLANESSNNWVSIPTEVLKGYSAWVTGGTGGGKTCLILWLIQQLLPRPEKPSIVIIIDLKAELASWVRDLALPLHLMSLDHQFRQQLLKKIIVIDPFSSTALPPLNLLKPETGVSPEVQAVEISLTIGEMLETGDRLGVRMLYVLKNLIMIGIEANLTLIQVRELILNEGFRNSIAPRLSPANREWLFVRLDKEPHATKYSLLARLDGLLMLEQTRLALSADTCVNFAGELTQPAVIIVDLGNPPAGAEPQVKLYGSLLFGRLGRAIFSRPVGNHSLPVYTIIDEFQDLLRNDQATLLERLITQARWKKVGFFLTHQSPAQIEAVSTSLLKIMRQNVTLEAHFRSDPDSVRHLVHMLPTTGRRRRILRPWEAAPTTTANMLMSPTEERQELAEDLCRLPQRYFWLNLKQPAWWGSPRLIKSPFVDFTQMNKGVQTIPAGILKTCNQGVLSVPINVLREKIRIKAQEMQPVNQEPISPDKFSNKKNKKSPQAPPSGTANLPFPEIG